MDNGLISLPARADSPNVSVVRREAPLTLVAGVGSEQSRRTPYLRGRKRQDRGQGDTRFSPLYKKPLWAAVGKA